MLKDTTATNKGNRHIDVTSFRSFVKEATSRTLQAPWPIKSGNINMSTPFMCNLICPASNS